MINHSVILGVVAALGAGFTAGAQQTAHRMAELRAPTAQPSAPGQQKMPTQGSRASAKIKAYLRAFSRGGSRRRNFAGLGYTVAEGKRRARKARNRARHKAHCRGRA